MTNIALTPEESEDLAILARHPAVEKKDLWYQVNTPDGDYWTFEDEDMDIKYIENALYAWSRWLDFVKDVKGVDR